MRVTGGTITVQHADIYHKLGSTIVTNLAYLFHDRLHNRIESPDTDFGSKPKDVNMYSETYFLDENSQLERRVAVGDKNFIAKIKNEKDKLLMKEMIKDIQSQLLTHNSFVKCFQDFKAACDAEKDDAKQGGNPVVVPSVIIEDSESEEESIPDTLDDTDSDSGEDKCPYGTSEVNCAR
jgi:hypothetical protein